MFFFLSCALPPSDYEPIVAEYIIWNDCETIECPDADAVRVFSNGKVQCSWGCADYEDYERVSVTFDFYYDCNDECYKLWNTTIGSDSCFEF